MAWRFVLPLHSCMESGTSNVAVFGGGASKETTRNEIIIWGLDIIELVPCKKRYQRASSLSLHAHPQEIPCEAQLDGGFL